MPAKATTPLSDGIIRSDLPMADGRTIRYYDIGDINRSAKDARPIEAQPGIGELRFDPLVNEWVAVASHRQGRVFLPPKELCPLCPTRGDLSSEIPDSSYQVVVFDNRSPSFTEPSRDWALTAHPDLFSPDIDAAGKCEVICYTDQHEGSFGELPLSQIRMVMEAWRDRTREISTLPYVSYVFPFENRGEEVGVTLNHPHGQVYAYPFIPPRAAKMMEAAVLHHAKTGRTLMEDVIAREIKDEVRIIAQNAHWIAFVPYAARYPFEIHLAPKKHFADLAEITDEVAGAFPEIAKEVLLRLDGVFGESMAYIAAWHQAPVHEGRELMRVHWQITSVRRAPGKLKYLAGSESAMGAFIMDLEPEQSAAQLRAVAL